MKKKVLMLLALFFLAGFFTACVEAEEISGTIKPLAEEVEGVTFANLQVRFATEELLSQFDSYHEITVGFGQEADYNRIAITTELPVERIGFYEFGFRDDLTIEWTRTLYFIQELSFEKPFVATWMPDLMYPRGITLSDEMGERFFMINQDDDGNLYFSEIKVGIAPAPDTIEFDIEQSPRTEFIGLLENSTAIISIAVTDIDNELEGSTQVLTQEDVQRMAEILRTMEVVEVLTPFHNESQQSNPIFIIEIAFADGGTETIFTTETGVAFFRLTGTYGDHDYVIGRNDQLFEILATYF